MEINIEDEYRSRMQALTPLEKVARSMAMLKWTRDAIARQIQAERGPLSNEQLKWEVALRLYGNEPSIRRMIETQLALIPPATGSAQLDTTNELDSKI
jgi:hypothetical protein